MRRAILGAGLVAALSWLGLGLLLSTVRPAPWPLLVFFVLLFVATWASLVPVTYYLNRRFAGPPANWSAWRPFRQSLWGASLLVLWAWLQLNRALNWPLAVLLVAIFSLAEVIILLGEK